MISLFLLHLDQIRDLASVVTWAPGTTIAAFESHVEVAFRVGDGRG